MTGKSYDIAIIGAGIIGLSTAWQIARRSNLKVIVLEKGVSPGEGSTGASSAICRYRYSMDEMVILARDGILAYQQWQAFTGMQKVRASFHNEGVLWMPGGSTGWSALENQRMTALGINTEVLDRVELKKRFPAINPCTVKPDLESGQEHECRGDSENLLETDGGYMDPVSALQDLVEACRNNGVTISFKSQVKNFEFRGGAICGLETATGEKISTPLIINSSGPWCHNMFNAAGLDIGWKLRPVRIQVMYRDRPDEVVGQIPVTVDMENGIYFRTQNRGQQLLVSSVREEDEREEVSDPDNYLRVHDAEFEHVNMYLLHHRLKGLAYRGKIRGNCGLYTVNLDDVHPVVGQTRVEGFWVANGFSGHGFKLAPAIGSMLARELTREHRDFDTDIPLTFFAIDRKPINLSSKSVLA